MKLVNVKYNIEIILEENKVDVLVVESPQIMTEIVSGIQLQCNGEEGDFVLSNGDKILKMDKCMSVVINPFSINLNEKKIVSKLYSELKVIGNEYFVEKEEVNSKVVQLLDRIVSDTMYNNVVFDLNLDWDGLFKLYTVKIENSAESLLENIIEYTKILSRLCEIKIVCLVNIKSYLDEEEIKQLYEMAFYNKIQLLIIESNEKTRIDNENIYIIDKDKCLIVK